MDKIQLATATLALLASTGSVVAQSPADYVDASGAEIYRSACANCHGVDGTGQDPGLLAFEEPMPDFTDCDFAVREPDSDWVAVAHRGGPTRGFSPMMPAFAGALTPEQLQRAVDHIRSFCVDDEWPEGELNLPRGLLVEKAYPEDEWVVEGDADLEGEGAFGSAFVYEQRFGPRSQLEVKLSYGWAPHPDAPAGRTDWVSGFGDAVLGVKHALHHDGNTGRILAVAGEVILPTGDEARGFGAPGTALEGFVSFGQILPGSAFLQAQSGVEVPLYDEGEHEGFARASVGRTFTRGQWGRAWSPMIAVQAGRELTSGATTSWDLIPQLHVTLNTRQHVQANVGVLVPVTDADVRPVRLLAYVLLDWFDGGFFEGW
ncbi:MAG: cytochrome c [Longimicrobiales bacterium]|nr:cytochrome c [Longimicrobiales bacterium]